MNKDQLLTELTYKAIRSGGAGGQHVNKVSSKVVLSFDLKKTQSFTESEKVLLSSKLKNRLSTEGVLQISCDESRSQIKNKDLVIKRFIFLIQDALVLEKVRKETRVPKSVIKKRIKDKKIQSEIKNSRRKPDF